MLQAEGDERPRGRRPKNLPDGRRELIRAGIEAFARVGFDAADLRGIAASAGVSQSLVRVHFGNKADFWEACLHAVVQQTEEARHTVARISGDETRDTFQRLGDVLRTIAVFSTAHPDIRDFVTRYGSEAPQRVVMLVDRLLRPAYETMRALCEEGMAQGIIRSDHPALFFMLVNNALNPPSTFPHLLHGLEPSFRPCDARERMTETAIATLLHEPRPAFGPMLGNDDLPALTQPCRGGDLTT